MTSAQLDSGGMPFDRCYMFVDGLETRKGKPLTARQVPHMLGVRARVDGNKVSVATKDGSAFDVGDRLIERLQSAFGRALSIEAAAPHAEPFHDAHDILVVNAASVRELSQEWGKPVNVLRFRPNIVVDGDDAIAYAENDWIGHRFRLGEAELEAMEANVRCAIPTIDPETLEVDSAFLKLLVDRHNQCFGVYCKVRGPGSIALGDEWRPLSSM